VPSFRRFEASACRAQLASPRWSGGAPLHKTRSVGHAVLTSPPAQLSVGVGCRDRGRHPDRATLLSQAHRQMLRRGRPAASRRSLDLLRIGPTPVTEIATHANHRSDRGGARGGGPTSEQTRQCDDRTGPRVALRRLASSISPRASPLGGARGFGKDEHRRWLSRCWFDVAGAREFERSRWCVVDGRERETWPARVRGTCLHPGAGWRAQCDSRHLRHVASCRRRRGARFRRWPGGAAPRRFRVSSFSTFSASEGRP